jgi:hypothetical protein
MQNLTNLEESVLIDMLADYTAELTRLLQEKNRNEEYLQIKQAIKQLTAEIEARRSSVKNDKHGLVGLS